MFDRQRGEIHESFLPLTHTTIKQRDEVPMFENAQNFKIKDSSFTVNVGTAQYHKFDQLLETASLNAVLNAGGRADEVRCYPGTREEVIGKVERWRDGKHEPDRRILWLSGHAGAGKSAIAQTVAERGRESGVPAANFFFFRGDHTRNHAHPLVATLLYQLVKIYPSLRQHLTDALNTQPLLHKASVGEQMEELLASPIESVQRFLSTKEPIILIIDGLDECTDEAVQLQILGALHALVSRDSSLFRVFVASRAEPHLVMFFNKITSSVESLFLGDEYRPEDDIRKFVIAKFNEIKRTHHLAHTLGKNWPTIADIDKITEKSSGQFIFSATVMRFIEYSKDSPLVSLLTVHQLRPPTTHSPFAQLDALYSHVFSKARDIRVIKWALGFDSLRAPNTNYYMLHGAGYETIDLESLVADISAIAQISIFQRKDVVVKFYHRSLPDYLKDQSRSGIYHLDTGAIAADAATVCLQKFNIDSLNPTLYVLKFVMKPTTELSKSLLIASQSKLRQVTERPANWDDFICAIVRLYFPTEKGQCTKILRGWIWFAYTRKFDPALKEPGRLDKAAHLYYELLRLSEKAAFALWRGFNR